MDSKMQKKHESDMTRKEKRELEREKLSSMNLKQRVEYILSYYKYHIAGIVIVIVLAFGMVGWMDRMKDESIIYAGVINAPGTGGTIMEDFKESIGDTEEHNIYQMDTTIYTENGAGQGDYTSQMKLTTLVGAGTVDLYICPEDIYQNYKQQEILSPVSDIMGQEFVKENKDICEQYAIRIEENKVLEKYGLKSDEPGYLIIFRYTKHPDKVKQFVEFIME